MKNFIKILLFTVILILTGCSNQKLDVSKSSDNSKKNLIFTRSPCSNVLKEDIGKFYTYRSDDTLKIETVVVTNCSVKDVQGDFEIKEDDLILKCNILNRLLHHETF